jgi:TonB family protein
MCKIFPIILIASLLCGCRAPSSKVSQFGGDPVAEAVYDQYDHAWNIPVKTVKTPIRVKALVIIAEDGSVISASIIKPSGDFEIDKSVQRALDDVHRVAPFGTGFKNEQRRFYINFNLRPKA